MDTERPGENDEFATTEATASLDATNVAYADTEPVAEPKSRLLLGALAGLGVVVLGIAAWVGLFLATDRDFPGIAVVGGLLIGYVVREVSRRSDVLARLVSAVLTAILCVVGAVAAVSAYLTKTDAVAEADGFLSSFKALIPHAFPVINERYQPRAWLTWAIFVFAVGVAWFSTAPAKPKRPKTAPAAAPAEDPYPGDE